MALPLRVALIVLAVLILVLILRGLRKGSFEVLDTVFWLLLSLLLVIAAIVPQLVYVVTGWFGVESPANLVFLVGIMLLLMRVFQQDKQITLLRQKLTTLVQNEALSHGAHERSEDEAHTQEHTEQ